MADIDRSIAPELRSKGRDMVHNIQFLRFVAATLVVFFHAHLAISTRLWPDQAIDFELYLFGFGAVGVHIFFVISGYIMILTNSRPGKPFEASRFFRKRIIRIYPIYWLLAALYVVVNYLLGFYYDFTPYALLSSLLLLPDHAPLIIGPAWTLSYEMYFYLMFGIAMIFGLRAGIVLLSGFFILAMGYGVIARPENEFLALATNSLLIEFLFGVWIGYLTRQMQPPRWLGWLSLLSAILLFAGGIAYGYARLPSAVIWGIPSGLLIFGAVTLESYYKPAFVRWGSVLGDSSYTLYLAHILLITVMVAMLKWAGLAGGPVLVFTALFSVVAIVLSHWFHLRVEAPMTSWLNSRFNRAPAVVAAQ